jgi:hypothetical protein
MDEASNQCLSAVSILITLAVLTLLSAMFTQREYPAIKPAPSQVQAPGKLPEPRPELTPQDVVPGRPPAYLLLDDRYRAHRTPQFAAVDLSDTA